VHPVIGDPSGTAARVEQWLARAKCSACKRSFTCLPEVLYPRRQYQLDVVAAVVAAVSLGNSSVPAAAREAGASPTSARRWVAWVAGLASPSELLRVTAQIDPAAPVGIGLSRHAGDGVRARAARVLDALEQLGTALGRRGVALAQRSGLGRVLGWQRSLFGDVVGLVAEPKTLSPAMALGGAPSGR
jgi:transposase-like protein